MTEIILKETEAKGKDEKGNEIVIGTVRITVASEEITELMKIQDDQVGTGLSLNKCTKAQENIPASKGEKEAKLKKFGYTIANIQKIGAEGLLD